MIKCLSGFVTSLDSILMRSESPQSWPKIRKEIIKKASDVAITGGVERSAVSEGGDRGILSFPRVPVSGPVPRVEANPTPFHASLDTWQLKKVAGRLAQVTPD